ncbi:MAG: protease complex subunit PrcB family protein [Ectothiorhodospiraceae bacterium]|nr:protease complex subunit PrcB family protein [Ectothiorhodospiraceae bacterium]
MTYDVGYGCVAKSKGTWTTVNSRRLATVIVAMALAGCAAGESAPVEVELLERGAHCGAAEPGLAWERADGGWQVRLSMGEQPTGGFGLELADARAVQQDGVWELQVHWREPGPDELVTQALTRPCMLLAVPWSAPVALRVLDQRGTQRLPPAGGQ